jgi:hypothetical protein
VVPEKVVCGCQYTLTTYERSRQAVGTQQFCIWLGAARCNALSSHQWLQNWQISALHLSKTELLVGTGGERMAEVTKQKGPVYKGIYKYWDREGGYAVWLPVDWRRLDMARGRRGWIFTPYEDHFDTCFISEKITLDYKVKPEDVEILMEGFEAGINSLPEVEIEHKHFETGKMIVIMEAKFTFMENGQRRKRWVKNMYWGEANLVLIAQGQTVEDYAYWEPMFFNTMMTYEIT